MDTRKVRAAPVCYWVDKFVGGHEICLPYNEPWLGRYGESQCYPPHAGPYANHTWNDCASSLINTDTHCTLRIYKDINYTGTAWDIRPGEYVANLTDRGANDAISAHRFIN